jgi:mRNA interferase RelE/StbE
MATGPQYRIEFTNPATKQLGKLPRETQGRLIPAINDLAAEPRPHGVEKLEGYEDQYRIRVGKYRVVYKIEDDRLIVTMLRIGHRRDIYRRKK